MTTALAGRRARSVGPAAALCEVLCEAFETARPLLVCDPDIDGDDDDDDAAAQLFDPRSRP